MKKLIVCLGFSAFLFTSCNSNTAATTETQASPAAAANQESPAANLHPEANIQRIVCFKFKAGTTPEDIDKHMRGFAGLKDSISYILSYNAGPTVLADLNEKGEYDVMHYTTYRNEEEIKQYAVHPVHKRFIENNKAIWEKVLVINSKVRP